MPWSLEQQPHLPEEVRSQGLLSQSQSWDLCFSVKNAVILAFFNFYFLCLEDLQLILGTKWNIFSWVNLPLLPCAHITPEGPWARRIDLFGKSCYQSSLGFPLTVLGDLVQVAREGELGRNMEANEVVHLKQAATQNQNKIQNNRGGREWDLHNKH